MIRFGRFRVLGALTLVLALASSGCSANAPGPTGTSPTDATPAPTAPASGVATPTTSTATEQPTVTAAPTQGTTATPGPTGAEPLPEPSLTEPADIATALFDSTRVADGVVSLIDVMGIAVYDAGGALVRPGADRGAGDLTLTENEVRGLIAMTQEDLRLQTEAGGPFPVADMYAALQPSLPADFTLEQFLAAYNDAYAEEPEALAAQVMRGQALGPETGLLRVQMWLLLIDGFVGPPEGAALPAFRSGGFPVAHLPAGQTLGSARSNLPPVIPPAPGFSSQDWAELLRLMPTLAFRVPFEVLSQPVRLHEGHGAPGAPAKFFAAVGVAAPVTSSGGDTLLAAAPRPGVPVRWESPNEPIWNAHGAFDQTLGTVQLVDPGQLSGAAVTFTPKKEDANGAGSELLDDADLVARADQAELISHSFDVRFVGAALALVTGSLAADGPSSIPIWWHQLGDGYKIDITWTDFYDGIPDTITFRGLADQKDTSVQGYDAYYIGDGTATGDRAGWKSCNPGIDLVPSGSGPAEFQAGVQDDRVEFGAFPSLGNPLAGILAWPFTANADFEVADVDQPAAAGALCPHSIHASAEITPFGHPRP